MKKAGIACLGIFLIILICSSSFADVRLPAIISDNMVLQQHSSAPIWGWADAGEKVTVKGSWQWLATSTKADKDGKWMLKLRTPKAGGPYTLTVKGKNNIQLNNILIGEVWVCSGQSNMEFTVGNTGGWRVGTKNYRQEIQNANYPNIRFAIIPKISLPTVQDDCQTQWLECNPKDVNGLSAAAYFFGRRLHKDLNVPIGLISVSCGGTPAESWMKKEILEADPEYTMILQREKDYQTYVDSVAKTYPADHAKWQLDAADAAKEGKPAPTEPTIPQRYNHITPSGLYNSMLHPLIPFRIKGAIWYQGESNIGRAYQYRKLFPEMIKNWRQDWGQGDFPFYYIQLAPYHCDMPNGPMAAELRQAQLLSLSVPNTGMAVAMDIGDVNDIHPTNKQDVGERLALWALAKTYGKEIVFSGPFYKSMKIEGDKIRLTFDYTADGLVAKGGELREFTIAGPDQNFVPAKAVIDGKTVLVSSEQVKNPVAVRFAWRNAAQPNLFNTAGLPAPSFKTDDWPWVTAAGK